MNGEYNCFDRSDEKSEYADSSRHSCFVLETPYNIQVKSLSKKTILQSGERVKHSKYIEYECTDPNQQINSEQKTNQCENGKWQNEVVPTCQACMKTQIVLSGVSSNLTCRLKLNGEKVDCVEPFKSDITVTTTCERYFSRTIQNETYSCDHGKWNINPEPCQPICGSVAPHNKTLGNNRTQLIVPWHAAIFQRTEHNKMEQVCCGSIIGLKTIISAAHCFETTIANLSDYEVGVGLFFNDYVNNTDADRIHLFKISEIIKNRLYEECQTDNKFEGDIAILILHKSIKPTEDIQLICIHGITENIITENKGKGKVYGWRLKNISNATGNELKSLAVPIIEEVECKKYAEKHCLYYKTYILHDKICAGHMNASIGASNGVRSGDSGTGLVLESGNKFYLYGILSNIPSDTCKDTISLYTKTQFYYYEFINKFRLLM